MTTGAAYDLAQALGWKSSLHAEPREAKAFYALIAAFTLLAVLLNSLGFNAMKAVVYAGIVQGFSTPPLMLFIVLMTNDPAAHGRQGQQPLVQPPELVDGCRDFRCQYRADDKLVSVAHLR